MTLELSVTVGGGVTTVHMKAIHIIPFVGRVCGEQYLYAFV